LLVLDNYDTPNVFQSIKDYLPETKLGCLIITSRHEGVEILGPVVTVSGMTEDEAVQLLLQATKIETTTENYTLAKVIVQKLAFFALAIDQAASYIFSRQLPLKDFLNHYDHRTRAIFEHTPAHVGIPKKARAGRQGDFSQYFHGLGNVSRAARRWG
jgi:hypothetical protein